MEIFRAIKEELGFCASIKAANPAHFETLCGFLERHPEAVAGYVIGDLTFVRNPKFGGIDLHPCASALSRAIHRRKNASVSLRPRAEQQLKTKSTCFAATPRAHFVGALISSR